MIPNRGARIGHQSHDHFLLVAYCRKYGFNFVYHPFICASKSMGDILGFSRPHMYEYDSVKHMRTLTLADISGYNHNSFMEIHAKEESILVCDHICGNETFFKRITDKSIAKNVLQIKKEYRLFFKDLYPRPIHQKYVCIHIRYGDIANISSRVLGLEYYIGRYKYLSETCDISGLQVYIVTEPNFTDTQPLYDAIPSCVFVQGSEIEAFYYLVNCSYLIASRSGFSNLAYILGGMKVIRPPLDWNMYWDNLIE